MIALAFTLSSSAYGCSSFSVSGVGDALGLLLLLGVFGASGGLAGRLRFDEGV